MATEAEIEQLAAIELDASVSLIEAGVPALACLDTSPRHALEASFTQGLLFIGADLSDVPIAFMACTIEENALFIAEIDVVRRLQGKGIGRALVLAGLQKATEMKLWGAMLTTDRHVPFNARFYKSLGFYEPCPAEMPAHLTLSLYDQFNHGHDRDRRVGLMLRFDNAET